MLKNILLLALVSCTLLASVQAMSDMMDRLKDRVIHVETLQQRGRWLKQIDNQDSDGNRYLYVDELAERDTYYTPRVQFQTTVCGGGKYLCLESVSLRNYYLAAGFPPGESKHTVKMTYSTYTEDNNQFHWTIKCDSDTLDNCMFMSRRFADDEWHMIADEWGGSGHDGHFDASLGTEDSRTHAYWRVHAPNPTDGQNQIYENTNTGSTEQLVKYSTKVGVSQTTETSNTVSSSTSMEIGASFKAFSSSVSSTIENSWTTTDTTTYEASKTVEHDIKIKARTRLVMKQLKGNYAGAFTVGEDSYTIEEYPLDSGATRTYKMQFSGEKVKTSEKEEL